jgi:cell division protein FtsZ
VLGKAGIEAPKPLNAPAPAEQANASLQGLNLQPEIAQDDRPPRPVHQSKLRRKNKTPNDEQEEFLFVDTNAQRGYFDKTDRNLYNDEDLDVPTFMRRGIKIKIKV